MQKEIILNNQKIPYTFRKSQQARYMRLIVKNDATLIVSVPWILSEKRAVNFIQQKADWILKQIDYFKNKKSILPLATKRDYLKNKLLAQEIAEKKIKHFNQFYNFKINKISIRNPKTRWGSCSKSGNLNFSYRIIYLSEEFSNYIIVHELCHLGEFNHSKKFWELVKKTVPDYKRIRKEIKYI